MKERSVAFYKRLIIITFFLIVSVIAICIAALAGNLLGVWGEESSLSAYSQKYSNDDPMKDKVRQNNENNKENQEESTPSKEVMVPIEPDIKKDEITDKNAEPDKSKNNLENIITNNKKVVYLTFDDGSSMYTEQILKTLKQENVKATFFFNADENHTSDEIITQAYKQGHCVGVLNSSGYDYKSLYATTESYLKDLDRTTERIYKITGKQPTVARFPGGSKNSYNKHIYEELVEQVTNKGFSYYDWNVCAQDSSSKTPKDVIVVNATQIPKDANQCIILMHDNGNINTIEALKEIIEFYRNNGFEFEKLTSNVKAIRF